MALVLKTSPVGIDIVIQALQTYLYNNLTTWTNYQSYGRAYLNESERGIVAEVYDSKGEYKDCLFDDKFNVTSFFMVDQSIDYVEKGTANVSLIVQANLKKLYPSILHRADEELHNDVITHLRRRIDSGEMKGIETGLSNVYDKLKIDNIKYTDISDFHCVKFDFVMNYEYNC